MTPSSWTQRFLHWYFIDFPKGAWQFVLNLSPYLEDMLALRLTLKNLLTPIWHDTTLVGQALSLTIRLLWLLGGALIWILTVTLALTILPLWFLGHGLLVVNPELWLIWLSVIAFLFALRLTIYNHPWQSLPQNFDQEKTLWATPPTLRAAISAYPNLSKLEITLAKWWQRLGIYPLTSSNKEKPPNHRLPTTNDLLKATWQLAKQSQLPEISSKHLILALTQIDPRIQNLLKENHLQEHHLRELVRWIDREEAWWATYPLWSPKFTINRLAGVNRALTGVQTPILDQFSVDLTRIANQLPEAVNRQSAYHQVIKILGTTGRHVLVVGEAGCGKTTFVGGLAQMIIRGGAPPEIATKRLVKLEPGLIIAGTQAQGELSQRMITLLEEARFSEDIIIFIDEIHTLLTAKETPEGLNLYSIMEPLLTNPAIQVIGATTIGNYRQFIEPNQAFSKMFELVRLDQVKRSDLMAILENITAGIETRHQVTLTLQSLETAIDLSSRYIHDRVLPDKAVNLLEKAAILAKETHHSQPKTTNLSPTVVPEHIAQIVATKTGVPIAKIDKNERQKLLQLEDQIHQAFVNQRSAVTLIADALRRSRLDLKETTRPIGSFLFVGPTGVGKTELARRLAEVYFGSESAIIRLDMSEFSHPETINRLIGAPPGTPGFGQAGELTEKVRRQPFALIVLDEIEKAHPAIWNLFLQIMDEGRLTDSTGKTIDFKNTILIFTSNAVTDFITQELAKGRQVNDFQKPLFQELQKTFRIEFLNRFDGIIPFRALTSEEMKAIAKLQLDRLVDRLAEKQIKVKYPPSLITKLAQLGTSPTLGARPLKRLIQNKVESQLAKILLESPPDKTTVITLKPSLLD